MLICKDEGLALMEPLCDFSTRSGTVKETDECLLILGAMEPPATPLKICEGEIGIWLSEMEEDRCGILSTAGLEAAALPFGGDVEDAVTGLSPGLLRIGKGI